MNKYEYIFEKLGKNHYFLNFLTNHWCLPPYNLFKFWTYTLSNTPIWSEFYADSISSIIIEIGLQVT